MQGAVLAIYCYKCIQTQEKSQISVTTQFKWTRWEEPRNAAAGESSPEIPQQAYENLQK